MSMIKSTIKLNKYIYLKKYTLRRRDDKNLDDFRKDIIECLGDEIFEYENLDDLVFSCLKVVHPVNKNLKNEELSIQNKSLQVLKHFGFDRVPEVNTTEIYTSKIGENGERIPLNKDKIHLSPKEKFLNEIIRFKDVPNIHWKYLKENSEYHLLKITQLVNSYLSTPFISKNYWKDERVPSNQQERILLDYYKRCLSEQQTILAYRYGTNMRDRAIAKATKMPFNLTSNIFNIFDFPYYSSKIYSEGYFDHEKIDKVYHRLVDTTVSEEDENYRKLYFNNKRLFYSKLFKEYPARQYFNDIKYYSQILPLSDTRKSVLNELEFLFQKKKWVSFYGIALSLIEGLFLEMTNVIGTKGKRSLYYKINEIRDSDRTGSLDYYQYYMPQLRNKFMHGSLNGEEENKVNSFDLLTDIRYLLKIFHELDSPLVQLKKILSNDNYIFPSIEEISSFFQLLNANNNSLRVYVSINTQKIKEFLKEKLIENRNLDVIIFNLKNEIKKDIETAISFLNSVFYEDNLDYISSNPNGIRKFFEKDDNLVKLKEESFILGNKLNALHSYDIFLSRHKKWFINIDDSTSNALKNIEDECKNDLTKLMVVSKILIDYFTSSYPHSLYHTPPN